MVGELVGARLIAHAGSLMNLAKQPASTVQILGAEKALFRALKAKHDTPKYGLIYHASLVGQSQPKHRGKISRVLAAKCALSIRVDALGDTSEPTVGIDGRLKVEERMRTLEGRMPISAEDKADTKPQVVQMYANGDASRGFSAAGDSTMVNGDKEKKAKKADKDEDKDDKAARKAAKKKKEAAEGDVEEAPKKKKKKDVEADAEEPKKKKKKKE